MLLATAFHSMVVMMVVKEEIVVTTANGINNSGSC